MSISSRALRMAHLFRKDKPDYPWSDCVRRAWWFVHFRKQLAHGFATFSFFKKDGSIREARGTLFFPLIPADKHPKGENEKMRKCENAFSFFDLDKQEWRSFDITNFIGFVTLYSITEVRPDDKKKKNQKEK